MCISFQKIIELNRNVSYFHRIKFCKYGNLCNVIFSRVANKIIFTAENRWKTQTLPFSIFSSCIKKILIGHVSTWKMLTLVSNHDFTVYANADFSENGFDNSSWRISFCNYERERKKYYAMKITIRWRRGKKNKVKIAL